ncbi:MAG TPA: hypothetical protein VMK16_01605 [Acidimicrobiales bacterium]|nr:hypothetical protein [Acidimicrobiales bacterium]
MKLLKGFVRFWYDFIVGDDWRLAIGVVVVVVAVIALAHHSADWWWLLPVSVAALLTVSVIKEMRRLRS